MTYERKEKPEGLAKPPSPPPAPPRRRERRSECNIINPLQRMESPIQPANGAVRGWCLQLPNGALLLGTARRLQSSVQKAVAPQYWNIMLDAGARIVPVEVRVKGDDDE